MSIRPVVDFLAQDGTVRNPTNEGGVMALPESEHYNGNPSNGRLEFLAARQQATGVIMQASTAERPVGYKFRIGEQAFIVTGIATREEFERWKGMPAYPACRSFYFLVTD